MNNEVILKMTGINKEFFGNYVLKNVNMEVKSGEIFAIIGQNGAGKSTLMKILAGVHSSGSYDGEIVLEGSGRSFKDVKAAENNGILMIPQEIEVFTNLTVAENLFFNTLSHGAKINWNTLYNDANIVLKKFGMTNIDSRQSMDELTRGQQQMLLIIKALNHTSGEQSAKILILDEPTASLTESEIKILFEYLDEIKKKGIACLYISHRLAEVFKIADRIMVMRNGEVIKTYEAKGSDHEEIISCMIGEKLKTVGLNFIDFHKEILNVEHLTVYDRIIKDRKIVDDVNFSLHEGEVLGIFGLLGSGKTETAMSIYSSWQGKVEGNIVIDGQKLAGYNTLDAMKKGINFLPEDRRTALFGDRSIRENMSIIVLDKFKNKFGILNLLKERRHCEDYKSELKLKSHSLENLPDTLSGGNKQKALIARVLAPQAKVLIFDEPSVGVDIGTRMDMYEILRNTAKETKCGIIVFSSDQAEILQVADRVLILKNGRIARGFSQYEIKNGKVDEDTLVMAAISA